jgi:hypothetical protein
MDKGTEKKLDAILEAIKNLESRVAKIETGTIGVTGWESTTRSPTKKISIKEFLLKHPPTDDIRRTLAIGYFLENQAGMASFTKADLESAYRNAKEKVPSNMSVNIGRCIKQGHMMEAADKKDNKTAYVVTRSGEEFVRRGYKADGK